MENGLNLIGMMLQTLIALAAVCGLAYLIFRVILPRLQIIQTSGMIRVVERVGVDARRSLLVVEVAGKWLLVGVSESGVQLVTELDTQDAETAETRIQTNRSAQMKKIEDFRSGFAVKLASVMSRKDNKNADQQPEKKKQFTWTTKK